MRRNDGFSVDTSKFTFLDISTETRLILHILYVDFSNAIQNVGDDSESSFGSALECFDELIISLYSMVLLESTNDIVSIH